MIGNAYDFDLSSIPGDVPVFDRIDRENFHWPGGDDTGGKNNFDQIGAWALLALAYQRSGNESSARAAAHNAREWVLSYLRLFHAGDPKDTAHCFLLGLRHYIRMLREMGKRGTLLQEAESCMEIYGGRAMESLTRYNVVQRGNGRPYYEARLIGRALANVSAFALYRRDAGRSEPVRAAGKNKYTASQLVNVALLQMDPLTFRLDRGRADSIGWTWVDGVPVLVLVMGRSSYRPDFKTGRPWHFIPWQLFSTLPYGIFDAWTLLDGPARRSAIRFLRHLREMAAYFTDGFRVWGDGGPKPLMSAAGYGLYRIPVVVEARAERSYSFRWLDYEARPMRGHQAFQPTCLPLKEARVAMLEEEVAV